jgi:actin-like ATPase involved in cell morphogenesis
MKRAYNLLIGERTAEEIKMRIGSAYPLDEELTMEVKGRDSVAGLPKTIHITSQEIREALATPSPRSSTPCASRSSAARPNFPPTSWTAAS